VDIVLRAVVVFAFLAVLIRVIGRRELSSLQPFDLILLIVLGDTVQQGLTQDDYSLTGALLAVGTIALLQVCVSFVSYRFPRARGMIEGSPIIVIENGRPIERNMRRERLDLDDVAEAARQQGIARLSEVKWAVLETSGQISFIKNDS
jgi:uncharacterized membrane protein YcaP (DUF421 family)